MDEKKLLEAVKAGNHASVKELIESGADVNQPDKQGWTPLIWAAAKGNLDIVGLLLQHGADVSKVGRDQRTPAMVALAAGQAEAVKVLRQAEDQANGENATRPERKYCLAYHLRDFRQFPGWTENKVDWKAEIPSHAFGDGLQDKQGLSEDDIAFLHQDYTVTKSIWSDENVIFNKVDQQWKDFCSTVLNFKVPDSLDLIVPASNQL